MSLQLVLFQILNIFPALLIETLPWQQKKIIFWGNDDICLLVSLKYPWWCYQKTWLWRWQWNATRKHASVIGNGVIRRSCEWKYNMQKYLGITPQNTVSQNTVDDAKTASKKPLQYIQHGEPCSDLQKIHLRFRIYRSSTNADNKDPRVGEGVSHDGSHTP